MYQEIIPIECNRLVKLVSIPFPINSGYKWLTWDRWGVMTLHRNTPLYDIEERKRRGYHRSVGGSRLSISTNLQEVNRTKNWPYSIIPFKGYLTLYVPRSAKWACFTRNFDMLMFSDKKPRLSSCERYTTGWQFSNLDYYGNVYLGERLMPARAKIDYKSTLCHLKEA